MNGIQIEHLLNLIEDQASSSRPYVRRELAEFINDHKAEIVEELARYGETSIPTSYGAIRLTREDLTLAVA